MSINFLFLAISFVASFFLSMMVIPNIIQVALRKRIFDEPDIRKIHTKAIPRLGGFAFTPIIMLSIALTIGLLFRFVDGVTMASFINLFAQFLMMCVGLILLYLIGLSDDFIGARYRVKFIFQTIAAACIPLSGLWIDNLHGLLGIYTLVPWIGIPLTIFLIVFTVNAINLIDGIDGLASGLSAISLVVMGVAFVIGNHWVLAVLSFSTVGVLMPFIYYNVFAKSKIFMGDAGSLTLGFILSFLALQLIGKPLPNMPDYAGVILAIIALFVPVFDVCRVIFIRFIYRKPLFEPDKNHIHHLLLRLGLNPRNVMISILFGSALLIGTNVFFLYANVNVTILFCFDVGLWTTIHVGLHYLAGRHRRRKTLEPTAAVISDKVAV
jgi:UDP-N-acetylmuramyl pentapeptide phosphotransferase/UDP-N-acetylglucosamine-1-phosphate transferase